MYETQLTARMVRLHFVREKNLIAKIDEIILKQNVATLNSIIFLLYICNLYYHSISQYILAFVIVCAKIAKTRTHYLYIFLLVLTHGKKSFGLKRKISNLN